MPTTWSIVALRDWWERRGALITAKATISGVWCPSSACLVPASGQLALMNLGSPEEALRLRLHAERRWLNSCWIPDSGGFRHTAIADRQFGQYAYAGR